jgi:SPP1 family predicted phage head-tail adaptor
MRAANRRTPMHVLRATRQQDATGQIIEVWAAIKVVWIHLKESDGAKTENVEGVIAERTFMAEMVTDAGLAISTKDRLTYGGRTFEIVSVVNQEQKNRITEMRLKETI